MTQPKCVFTDLGNVVLFFDRFRVPQALSGTLVKKSPAEIDAIINGEDGMELLRLFESGLLTPEEYAICLEKMLGFKLPRDRFWPIHNDIFWRNEAVIDLYRKMKIDSPEVKLFALTNTDAQRVGRMIKLSGLSFQGVVASFHSGVKAMKPRVRIFEFALDRSEVKPEESLFIDDIAEYVQAAKALGMHAHHYSAPHLLEEELRRFNLIR